MAPQMNPQRNSKRAKLFGRAVVPEFGFKELNQSMRLKSPLCLPKSILYFFNANKVQFKSWAHCCIVPYSAKFHPSFFRLDLRKA